MNKGERTREMILNRGMLQSSQYGLADITIGSISKLCNLSRTGVISHFKNKDDMQIAILDYSARQFVTNVVKPSRDEDALTRLKLMLHLWVDWTEKVFETETTSCPFIKAIVEYEHRDDSPVKQHAFTQQQDLLSFMTHLVEKTKKQKTLVTDVASHDIAFELYSLYVGATITSSFLPVADSRQTLKAMIERSLQRYQPNS